MYIIDRVISCALVATIEAITINNSWRRNLHAQLGAHASRLLALSLLTIQNQLTDPLIELFSHGREKLRRQL